MNTPVTTAPASLRSAAETAESTPPESPTNTFFPKLDITRLFYYILYWKFCNIFEASMPKITPDRNESLQQLRRVVEAAPIPLFHMDALTQERPCGTAHCAAAWAAIDPWFKERGLRINQFGDICYLDFQPDHYFGNPFRALELFFTLSYVEAQILFGGDLEPGHYVPKEDVLKNIDRTLSGGKMLKYLPQKLPDSIPK